MPRNARVVSRRPKRQTKWCAEQSSFDVPDTGALAAPDALVLCDNLTGSADQPDPLIGWCRGQISLSRNGTGTIIPGVAWAIVMMRVAPGTELPVQVFNPWLKADLERQDILSMGHCAVPPTHLVPSTDANVAERSSTVTEINCRVSRRFLRNTNQLFLWIVARNGDGEFHAEVTVRSLMKFG